MFWLVRDILEFWLFLSYPIPIFPTDVPCCFFVVAFSSFGLAVSFSLSLSTWNKNKVCFCVFLRPEISLSYSYCFCCSDYYYNHYCSCDKRQARFSFSFSFFFALLLLLLLVRFVAFRQRMSLTYACWSDRVLFLLTIMMTQRPPPSINSVLYYYKNLYSSPSIVFSLWNTIVLYWTNSSTQLISIKIIINNPWSIRQVQIRLTLTWNYLLLLLPTAHRLSIWLLLSIIHPS